MVEAAERKGVPEINIGPERSHDWNGVTAVWEWDSKPREVGLSEGGQTVGAQLQKEEER